MDSDDEEQIIMDDLNDMAVDNYFQNQVLLDNLILNAEIKRKYTVRKRIDPFQVYDENEFQRRYRLSKAQVNNLYELIDGRNTLEPMVNAVPFAHI